MREMLETSAFLGVVITLGSFELGRAMKKRWNFALFNPLLLGIVADPQGALHIGVGGARRHEVAAHAAACQLKANG